MANPQPVKAILFDLDDTLFDRRAAFERWAKRYLKTIVQVTDDTSISEILQEISSIDKSGYGSKKFLIDELFRHSPPKQPSGYTADDAFQDCLLETRLDFGATELLSNLDSRGIPWGIVTNGTNRQWGKIEILKLAALTKCIFVSDTFGSAKPDPEIFLAAADRLAILSREILFVGDHPVNDILGPHNVGMTTAWVHNSLPWPDNLLPLRPDYTIDHLSEILQIIQ